MVVQKVFFINITMKTRYGSTLYVPLAKNFPAADAFFFNPRGGVLWLLQITKNSTHDCKIKKMLQQFQKRFRDSSLMAIRQIRWVIVAPPGIATSYTSSQ